MKTQLLIRRYTQGLVEALKGEKEFLTLSRELSDFAELLLSHRQLLEALSHPFLANDKKIQIIKDILAKKKFSQKTSRFILVLTENNRLELLPEILELLPSRWNEKKGIFRTGFCICPSQGTGGKEAPQDQSLDAQRRANPLSES